MGYTSSARLVGSADLADRLCVHLRWGTTNCTSVPIGDATRLTAEHYPGVTDLPLPGCRRVGRATARGQQQR